MIRPLVAGLILVGLAVGIWALWPRETSDPPPTTVPSAVEPTTTTLAPTATSTTTTLPTTSTTADTHVVATVAEAEEILQTLWFGWFEGIYNQDEDRIREVVGTQAMLDAAREAFGAPFTADPSLEGVRVDQTDILKSDGACLVVWMGIDVSAFRGEGSQSQMVVVVRRADEMWKLASTWTHKDDLWDADCESELQPVS
ncbi:MAG: hypothetical protein ABW021_02925 [Acidimicrobiia bacterium]